MTIVGFIDTAFLKTHTSIEHNVDDAKLSPFIIRAQRKYLMDLIGSSFYNHLCNAFLNDTLTTEEYNFVIDYVQDMVAEWSHYLAYPHIAVKATNKGIVEQNSDNSTSAELAKMKIARNEIMDMAQFYSERIVSHLCKHSELYPAWTNPDTPEELVRSNKGYSTNVYIPGRRNRGCNGCDNGSQYK